MSANGESIIELKGVSKTYTRGKEEVHVLDNLDLTVRKGAFEAFMGPSGSGKSTLLNLIAGVDQASAGSVRVAGQELTRLGDGDLAKFRSSTLGFIFQQYNLLPVLNAQDNVELPLLLTSLGSGERKKRAAEAEAESESDGIFGWIASKVSPFFDALKQGITAIFDAAKKLVRAAIDAAKKLAVAVIEKARQAIVGFIRAVGAALIAIGDTLLAAFPGLREKWRGFIERRVKAAEDAAEGK